MATFPKTTCNGKKLILQSQKVPRSSTSPYSAMSIPITTQERLSSLDSKTIFYLAYGSNLSAETFKGTRGIRPISACIVHVPTLSLTFDLAGIPYSEPCFANTKIRDPLNDPHKDHEYHKDRWHKGLIGVVYEVTPEDFRTIIATEGGGASYQDVIVPCYTLPPGGKTVDPEPKGVPFMAHTLLQPREEPDENRFSMNTQLKHVVDATQFVQRPDPSYAQPSARYLNLITTGAEEHSLPSEYLAYLYNIRPYTITTRRQRLGQALFLAFWAPLIFAIIQSGKTFADDQGKIPSWLATLTLLVFNVMWRTYDRFYLPAFGNGERTQYGKRKLEDGDKCLWGNEKV
ncbi:hypothetical protein HYFRA_00006955 [Hymenoscyphus fraxineus]|uniref:gamma-glutamylcyclotransferase n=1 Tax=Hymenoscyphus fraxineus TaxID=746836 RepID=A0A9N9KMG3_9HELO|nr:hypothetical protein HYFRA_00006955 [Hymenoscyphus fraxineus]